MIIPVKFHYNQTKTFLNFHGNHGIGGVTISIKKNNNNKGSKNNKSMASLWET